jgi:hypothetical protein
MYDVGTFVDRYQVERVIGNDAVAVVYGVRHTMLGSRHALKLLTRNSQAADKALQGARDQATLHHPHVVAITDILHVASRVGLVMELVEGGSLEAYLASNRPSFDEALEIFQGIVRGVRHAHEHRVLHGGLAMRRILLDRTGDRLVPKVTGFGVEGAIAAGPDALDDVSRMAGLPLRLDTDADLTQLGAILYELLTGRRASAGSHPDPRTLVPAIPEEVAQLTNALTHGDHRTLGSCQAILERLDAFLDADQEERAPTRPVPRRAAPTIGVLAEPPRRGTQIVSGARDDVDIDAPTDPGAMSRVGGGGVAAVAMAGEGIGPLPPPMRVVDDDEDESPPVPERADTTLPPDDSLPRIERPAPRRPAMWLVAAALLLAPALGLTAAFLTREPQSAAPVAIVPEAPAVEIAAPPPEAPVPEAPAVEVAAAPPEAPVPEGEPLVAEVDVPSPESAPPVAEVLAPAPVKAAAKPPPKPSEEPKQSGTIALEGDASQIWIELAGGWVSPGGSVPPGTYRVKALFDGPEPVRAGSVTVKPGRETVLRCSAAETECR